jgi:hypothetical protein
MASRSRIGRIDPIVLYASAARTATPTAVQSSNVHGERGGHFVINVTAVVDTPSVVPTVDGYDPGSDSWYNLLTGDAITATGTTVLKIYPGIGAIPGGAAPDILPDTWRMVMTHADADSITYSVTALLAQ